MKKPYPGILLFCSIALTGWFGLFGVEPAGAATHHPYIPGSGYTVDTVRIIRMKNGQTEFALETRRSGDTLFYRLVTEPTVSRGILYREVSGVSDTVIDSFREVMNQEYIHILESKIRHYQGKMGGGVVMMCLGGLAVGGGAVIISNNKGGSFSEGMATFGGALLCTAGAALVIPGIIIVAHGASKANTFREQLDNLSLGVGFDTRQAMVSLRYRIP